MSRFTVIFFSLLFTSSLISQEAFFILNEIEIIGNHHTSDNVILKEIPLVKGDTILNKNIEQLIEDTKLQILSTGLFNTVTVYIKNYQEINNKADVGIALEENWYIYPVPIFELADRNFSVWWQEQNRSLKRVNYGFRVSHYNFSGNKDPIKLLVHFGYTKKYQVEYDYPYLSKDSKWGIGGKIFFAENKEIIYKTQNNKSQFARNEDNRTLLSRFRIGPVIKFRPQPHIFNDLRLEYNTSKVDDYVVNNLNANYFIDNKSEFNFFSLAYDFSFDKRLYRHYPQGGYLYFLNLTNEGFGLFNNYNKLAITVGLEKHLSISKRLIASTRNIAKTNINSHNIPYFRNTALGWTSDIVSGYDLYVMDGTDYLITMNSMKFLLYDNNLNTISWMPRQFQKMNLTLFLRFNFDVAYIRETRFTETNTLNNRMIYGFGPALDMIFFNNFIFSLEYSFNDIGEHGLYLSNAIAF